MNYFELFEMPVSLKIDKAILNRKYIALQKKYHPDFFSQEDNAAQENALEMSSVVNKAMKIFTDTDSTLKYVLEQKGLLEEEEKYSLPPDFLMEVMELNEGLDEDSAVKVKALEEELYAAVAPVVEQYTDATVSPVDLQKLKDYYYKKKYLHRILERLQG